MSVSFAKKAFIDPTGSGRRVGYVPKRATLHLKGSDMIRYNQELLQRSFSLKVTIDQFFRFAHIWRFGRDVVTPYDFNNFIMNGAIPNYVCEYLDYIRENEHVRVVPKQP